MNQNMRKSMPTNVEAEITTIRQLKKGEFFRLKDSETAPVWVRGEYIPEAKKYSIHKFDDANHEMLRKATAQVYVGFTF